VFAKVNIFVVVSYFSQNVVFSGVMAGETTDRSTKFQPAEKFYSCRFFLCKNTKF